MGGLHAGRTLEKVPSIIRAMIRGVGERTVHPTLPEMARFLYRYKELILFVMKRLGTRKWRADVYAALAKAILWHGRGVFADPEYDAIMADKEERNSGSVGL